MKHLASYIVSSQKIMFFPSLYAEGYHSRKLSKFALSWYISGKMEDYRFTLLRYKLHSIHNLHSELQSVQSNNIKPKNTAYSK